MPADNHENEDLHPSRPALTGRRKLALSAAALLLLGGVAGAAVVAQTRPSVSMAPATPVAIRSLSSGEIATIRGQVAEIYGNKVIVADASGRALVDLGREGDESALVTAGEPVTVQGRFERGFIHAAFLVGPDNKVRALGPLAGPPHGPGGWHGPDHGPDGPPPPPGPAGAPNGFAPPPRGPAADGAAQPAPNAPTAVPNAASPVPAAH